jgi:hypothetical protein
MSESSESNKYYTPQLEEFHIGFEFQFQGCDGNWNPQGWETHTIVCEKKEVGVWKPTMDVVAELYLFYGEVDKNSFRVKYLDREDIESLGFEFSHYSNGVYCYQNFSKTAFVGLCTSNFIVVDQFEGRGENIKLNRLLKAVCKNKSKLKSLLKDVGIL